MNEEPTHELTDEQIIHDSLTEQFNYPQDAPTVAEMLPHMAMMLAQFMEWIYQGGQSKKSGVIIRTYVLFHMVNPNYFQKQIHMAKMLGVKKQQVNKEMNSFRDTFGYCLPNMHKPNKENEPK